MPTLLRDLQLVFSLNDLGDLRYFFSIEISKSKDIHDRVVLTQDKYASDLLKRVGISNYKPVTTSMSSSEKLFL